MRLTMLCGWQMSHMFSRLNIGVDLELFPIANLVDVYLKKILMLFRHLARQPGIPTDRDTCFETSAIRQRSDVTISRNIRLELRRNAFFACNPIDRETSLQRLQSRA
jgi:hypothetical protein